MERKPVEGKARLTLTITVKTKRKSVTTIYLVQYLHPADWADPAWRLTKADGTTYDVHLSQDGPYCTCPDFIYCREEKRKKCKHVEAARSVGLLRKDV